MQKDGYLFPFSVPSLDARVSFFRHTRLDAQRLQPISLALRLARLVAWCCRCALRPQRLAQPMVRDGMRERLSHSVNRAIPQYGRRTQRDGKEQMCTADMSFYKSSAVLPITVILRLWFNMSRHKFVSADLSPYYRPFTTGNTQRTHVHLPVLLDLFMCSSTCTS